VAPVPYQAEHKISSAGGSLARKVEHVQDVWQPRPNPFEMPRQYPAKDKAYVTEQALVVKEDALLFSRDKADFEPDDREDLYCEEDDLINIKKRLDFSKQQPSFVERHEDPLYTFEAQNSLLRVDSKPEIALKLAPKTHRESLQPK